MCACIACVHVYRVCVWVCACRSRCTLRARLTRPLALDSCVSPSHTSPIRRRIACAPPALAATALEHRAQFRQHVTAAGVAGASREDIDALFDKYDDDGGGSLDLEELKPTLKRLIETATAAANLTKELTKSLVALRKEARAQQKSLAAMRAKDAAEAKAKAEAEAEAKAEAEAAAAEAKRVKAEARRAAEARKAAEKEEYEARIAARREANKKMVTEDARVIARKQAQKSIDVETGEFSAKQEWKVAGLLARTGLIGNATGKLSDAARNGGSGELGGSVEAGSLLAKMEAMAAKAGGK